MGKYAQLVMGPAGSGKTTYCDTIQKHCNILGRSMHIINLDPAAEYIPYTFSIDIREVINVDQVMDKLGYGPNGGLIYCMEFLGKNLEWLEEEIGDYADDYLLIDCPGQIELFTHLPVMKEFVNTLLKLSYSVVSVYLLDSHFISDSPKFISGSLMCLSSMIQLELPHINVLSKLDLIKDQDLLETIDKFLDLDLDQLLTELNDDYSNYSLNEAIVHLLSQYNLVSYVPLNIDDEDSVSLALQQIDHAIQFGEDEEVSEPKSDDFNEFE
eukprot:TRINITY_DN210_c1_g1_i1.p1 TRINITY_DN210_c1_g1~~TRINITY_DN210_c1_g1_i1.p1  ORF type:complete len:269 (+),score=79.49 TRINITY_DN210_c1_g1_i1:89-895(+)